MLPIRHSLRVLRCTSTLIRPITTFTSSFPVRSTFVRTFSTPAAEEDSHNDFKPKLKTGATPSAAPSTVSFTSEFAPFADPINIEQAKEIIKYDVTNTPVFLYMKGTPQQPRCGFSANVVRILSSFGVTFGSRDVLSNDFIREGIKQYSDWPTLPQLYVAGEFVGGSDIVTNMYKSGELETLLAQHVKLHKPTQTQPQES